MIINNECAGLTAGIIMASNIKIMPSCEGQMRELSELLLLRKDEIHPDKDLISAVRTMMRKSGFKPSGRNKPASEYLLSAARQDNFPLISNIVDIINYFSLLWGLPISLLDSDVLGDDIILRTGLKGERYVFNASGQEIDIEGLISTCTSSGIPLGNPVKDSMAGKTSEKTKNVAGIIYMPSDSIDFLTAEKLCRDFAFKMTKYAFAEITAYFIV